MPAYPWAAVPRRTFLFLIVLWWGVTLVAGQLIREPAGTLRLPLVPGSRGYRLVDALGLQFEQPVALASPPGESNRLFVAELAGRVIVITNLAKPDRTLFLDLTRDTATGGEQGLLSLAFHPDYARNGRFFVYRVAWAARGREVRLSEFKVSPSAPSTAAPAELVVLSQEVEGFSHYGGDLHFGRDGYLYGSIGDLAAVTDNSQRIDGLLSSGIYRIDVDSRPESLAPNPHPAMVQNYRIPPANPFVGADQFLGRPVDPDRVRTELWAVGLRNPFRFSIDPATGELWIGDVGYDSFESIFVSGPGANHGWGFLEGGQPGPAFAQMPADFQTDPRHRYRPPVHSYSHDQGHSALGGIVYRGTSLAQLHGSYVFADHSWGHVYALSRDAGGAAKPTVLAWLPTITGFGADPRNGDVLLVELAQGRVWRLTYSDQFTGSPLPATLADTGAFSDLAALIPAPGVVPYSINLPFWSDGAAKQRWFSVPDTNLFLRFSPHDAWAGPPGTVWVKHFEIELTNGVAASRRRLETRLLVRNAAGIYGATYRWDSATNAVLVPETGTEEELHREANGATFVQRWRYPARGECLVCHTPQAGFVLGFNTAQLNCLQAYDGVYSNQITALANAGYFDGPHLAPHVATRLAHPTNELASLEWRARSYLAANCSPCHRPGGTALGFWDARAETPTALAGLLNGALVDPRGATENRVIVPGDPVHSVLLQRLATRGPGQMPPLASNLADHAGVELLRRWVLSLSNAPTGEVAAGLVPEWHEARARLRIIQPANRSVRLEFAERVDAADWRTLELPELEPFFPADPRNIILELEPAEATGFFRVMTQAP